MIRFSTDPKLSFNLFKLKVVIIHLIMSLFPSNVMLFLGCTNWVILRINGLTLLVWSYADTGIHVPDEISDKMRTCAAFYLRKLFRYSHLKMRFQKRDFERIAFENCHISSSFEDEKIRKVSFCQKFWDKFEVASKVVSLILNIAQGKDQVEREEREKGIKFSFIARKLRPINELG